jgi:protein gp37
MSKIEWTDVTDNPITVKDGGGHWCRKISEGCANCYAEAINTGNRFDFASGLTYTGKAPELELNYEMLAKWARMRSPKRHFVCSMTDWCGDWIPRGWQFAMLDAMAAATKQTFMLLTKRADILDEVVNSFCETRTVRAKKTDIGACVYPPNNIWFGVSVENQSTANTRLRFLAEIKAIQANTFVSFEPLLERVLIGDAAEGIDLAIVGAESGKGARPMNEDWVRSLRDEIKAANKAFFYKQRAVNGKKISLPELDGKVWSELP